MVRTHVLIDPSGDWEIEIGRSKNWEFLSGGWMDGGIEGMDGGHARWACTVGTLQIAIEARKLVLGGYGDRVAR